MSDKKIQHTANSTVVDYYTADVVTANDYYPFGMIQPGRKYQATSTSKYRFSINGQEKETELNENITTAEFWQYDSRLGRRWNVDPVTKVWESPYATFSNNPILRVDPYGNTDTTVTEAGGGHGVRIDNQINQLEFYQSSENNIKGENTKTPAQAGQLRAITNVLGRFSARWIVGENGAVSFAGYENDKGQTIEAAQQELIDFANSWKYKFMAWSEEQTKEIEKDNFGYNLKLGFTLLSMSMMADAEAGLSNPLGTNRSVTTLDNMSGLGTLKFTTSEFVTGNMVYKALQGSEMYTLQSGVSLPAIQRYVDKLKSGSVAPAIKVYNNIIIDGNHRYIAGRIMGTEPGRIPGAISSSQVPLAKPIKDIKIDPFDWGNH